MLDESSPIIKSVEEARGLAAIGNYEACLKAYASARDLIQYEQKNCRSRQENEKWSTLIKDIVSEEVKIRRIRKFMDDIIFLLNTEDTKRQIQNDKRQEQLHAKPDFALQGRANNRLNPSAGGNNDFDHQPRKPRRYAARASAPRQQQHQAARKIGHSPSKPSLENNGSPGPKSKENQSNSNNNNCVKRSSLDMNNPLIQQIINMGMLVKDPDVEWDSIAGLADIKKNLRQNLVILPMRPDIANGLLSPWRSVLLYGPPGTGKTYLAKAVATECNRTFFNISSSTILSRFLGESEKLITCLFDVADKMQPSTIFFDEIDALASQRGSENENEASRRVKSQLLVQMEGIDSPSNVNSIFIIAATNFPWDLDEALLRRFQKRVYIPLPDGDARRQLILMSLEGLIDEKFDVDMWSEKLDNYSCSDITNICRDAAQFVFDKQTEMMDTNQFIQMPAEDINYQIIVTNEDFEYAVKHRKSSVDQSQLKRYDEWKNTKGAE
ncbi:Katanin p60 ATPase-containing subunit A1 [Tritrichomonas musculus]|uniref:Katanin p60 ATPase-containing subunit A1 n=1 Tax=Tritrichomonas musculus TaxID=1915356 RepID=A0ABR2HVT4_9EUKA